MVVLSSVPKPTFFNLPDDKRERITELALQEFSERPFHRASLSRMVARAGIAKGSVYQYFDDKLDLYRWLLTEEVPRRKAAFIQTQAPSKPVDDFRGFLRHAVLSGVRFMLANPRLAQLASAITTPTDDPELRKLYADAVRTGHEAFVAMLQNMVAAGQLRADVDVALIARVISAVLGTGLRDILLGHLDLDIFDLFEKPELADQIDGPALEKLVDDLLELLIGGLGP